MAESGYCYLYLTCGNTVEASNIAKRLLEQKLVVCVKQIPTESHYHWKGHIENDSEVLLLMQSSVDLFEEVEAEIAKLHSYETYVLEAVPIVKISKGAAKWMDDNLKR